MEKKKLEKSVVVFSLRTLSKHIEKYAKDIEGFDVDFEMRLPIEKHVYRKRYCIWELKPIYDKHAPKKVLKKYVEGGI